MAGAMSCPRCGYDDVPSGSCPRCGVIVSKYRPEHSRPLLAAARQARPDVGEPQGARRAAAPSAARIPPPLPATRPSAASRPAEARAGWALLMVGLLMVAGLAALIANRRSRPRAELLRAEVRAPTAAPVAAHDVPPSAAPLDLAPVVAPELAPDTSGLGQDDFAAASEIAARLPEHVFASDAARAEDLLRRHPDQAQLREILAGVLMALAKGDLAARRFDAARTRLERAAALVPRDARPHIGLHNLEAALENWPQAENAIRAALERDPGSVQARRALAYALFRQDKNREAREVLRALLDAGDDPQARNLLERIEAALANERGMTEQRLAHFHVRYDGEAHEDVGREILRALERHYATLTSTFDHQLTTVVPVILFTREGYFLASGAPAWSGGVFDQIDGRIRIPIGGLTASLSPEMDGALIHELSHAFVHERTRGLAPRLLHEGLAQYMEGKRLAELSDEYQAALAGGRIGGVYGFYLEALAFAEYLMAQRGQGGVNDLLRAMGDSGDVDRAFREVYGGDYVSVQRAFRERFKQQTGQ